MKRFLFLLWLALAVLSPVNLSFKEGEAYASQGAVAVSDANFPKYGKQDAPLFFSRSEGG